MPRYRVLERSYINDRLHEAGDEVEFAHDPGFNLEPLDADAKKRAKAVQDKGRLSPNDPGYLGAMILRNLQEGDAMGPVAGSMITPPMLPAATSTPVVAAGQAAAAGSAGPALAPQPSGPNQPAPTVAPPADT